MEKKAIACAAVLALAAGAAWGKDDIMGRAKGIFKPIPAKAKALKGNPATPAKVELGKMLYFDPRLSSSHLISCNTCHNVGLGGTDILETSIGHGWQKGPRNSPTVLNAVYNIAQFWDGRAEDLAAQAKGPVQASVEMNNKPENLVATLKSIPGYQPLFKKAFPGEADPVTFDNVARAIEVFEATLVTPDAPFDRYLNGNKKALSATEEQGLALFLDKGCVACHSGINVGGTGYFPFGVREDPGPEVRPVDDTGRFKVTNTSADKYVFRSPSLRNVAITMPYFHSGKVWDLKDAVKIMGSAQLGISLTDDDAGKITAFMKTLTGKQPLVVHPVLPPNSDTTPRPISN
ncbi:cytochrome-c peroxidase [Geobacter benzoatilyticus]|uniref:Cytochrome-c peroxidase n=1 Tax=Geobacter benzoatilyticus TaxID=2815309 RepID=A0ABX7Q5Q5_9BACT|nr:cytochrome-c peroxidase [Geobacter benzoatilyticus]QSV46335.1 cytochrome-c peroxidase [Geobacter benzoatilyticus]